jgi:hypothetical protein
MPTSATVCIARPTQVKGPRSRVWQALTVTQYLSQ